MAKDLGKIKDEIRADLQKFKDELKNEIKSSKESIERSLRNEIREVRNEQTQMLQKLESANKAIEELKSRLDNETAKSTKLSQENDLLRTKCTALERTSIELDKRVVNMEQYSRNMNLEIKGITQEENENVLDIISQIGSAIQEPITEADIEKCHRVPTRLPGKPNLLIQFKSRAKRDAALYKAKKLRLTNKDAGIDNTDPIYVNEHLCPALKRLLGMATKRKHEYEWKSVWTNNGKIYAKQADGMDAVHISHQNDLDRIC